MRPIRYLVVTCLVALLSASLFAEDKAAADKKPTPEQAAMMEAFTKLGTPGPQHAMLAKMNGKFDADCTMKMDPNGPEEKSKGTAYNEMLYGGRYLQGQFKGTFMGAPFKGTCTMGFDNQKQKYVMTWIDSMSTMMMFTEGTADASGNAITFPTECQDPVTNQKMQGRQVVTVVDNDHYTMDAYQMKDGKEFKCMTITYTRSSQ